MADHQENTRLNRRKLLAGLVAAPTAAIAMPQLISANETKALSVTQHPLAEFSRRQIGDIEVIALADGYTSLPLTLMPNYDATRGKELARENHKTYSDTLLNTAINGYIIKTKTRTIAVDAGAPAFLTPNVGAWHESLALAGVKADDIDTLFLTHAHADHVAAMTGQNGERLLPNAQLITSDAEWQFAHDDAVLNSLPDDFKPMAHYSRGQMAPYAQNRQMVAMGRETEIAPGVTAVPMPGHTPGHMGLRVTSGDKSLMIWGDLVHAPTFQFAEPSWGIVFDTDMQQAHETRAKMLDQLSADGTLVAGMHLDFPALGFVEREKGNYRYLTAPRDYGA